MSTITNSDAGFSHMVSVILADLEYDVKELATSMEKEWPTIEDLLTSGQIGQDILKYLSMIEPVISLIELMIPASTPFMTWLLSIVKQIAALKILNTPCACPACTD